MIARAFWLVAAVIAFPLVAFSALRAVFRRPRRKPDLRVVGPPTADGCWCPGCRGWRERFGGER